MLHVLDFPSVYQAPCACHSSLHRPGTCPSYHQRSAEPQQCGAFDLLKGTHPAFVLPAAGRAGAGSVQAGGSRARECRGEQAALRCSFFGVSMRHCILSCGCLKTVLLDSHQSAAVTLQTVGLAP